MICRVCKTELQVTEVLKDKSTAPNIIRKNMEYKPIDMEFYKCPNCGHGQIEDHLPEDYYDSFSTALPQEVKNNKVVQTLRDEYFEDIVHGLVAISKNRKAVLDIGCGYGWMLRLAKEHYDTLIGVEPSKIESEGAKANLGGDAIIFNDYFGEHLKFENKISSFMAADVFEHLEDPLAIMKYLNSILEDGGTGVIAVPNGERYYNSSQYFEVFNEHISYFTVRSMIQLAEDANFEVLSMEQKLDGNALCMYVRKKAKLLGFENRKAQDKQKLAEIIADDKAVAFWGASCEFKSYISLFDKYDKLKYVFDVSNSKIGTIAERVGLLIEYPSRELVTECDSIIIGANVYKREIIETLKTKYQYTGKIVVIDEDVELVED